MKKYSLLKNRKLVSILIVGLLIASSLLVVGSVGASDGSDDDKKSEGDTSSDTPSMVIITTEELKNAPGPYNLQALADVHKNVQGVDVFIEAVEDIYDDYGYGPEAIREYIKDVYKEKNVDYVYLMGDDDVQWRNGMVYAYLNHPIFGPVRMYYRDDGWTAVGIDVQRDGNGPDNGGQVVGSEYGDGKTNCWVNEEDECEVPTFGKKIFEIYVIEDRWDFEWSDEDIPVETIVDELKSDSIDLTTNLFDVNAISFIDSVMSSDGGAIDDGAVDEGAIDDGAVDEGAIDDGAVDEGAIDDGAVDEGAIEDDRDFEEDAASGGQDLDDYITTLDWEIEEKMHLELREDIYISTDNMYYLLDDVQNINGYCGQEDFLSEVYVGRSPVSSIEDMQNVVRKTISYIQAPSSDYPNVMNIAEIIGYGGTQGSEFGDDITSESQLNTLVNNVDGRIFSSASAGSSSSLATIPISLNPNKGYTLSPFLLEWQMDTTTYDAFNPNETGCSCGGIKSNLPRIDGYGLASELESTGVSLINHIGHANIFANLGFGIPGYHSTFCDATDLSNDRYYPVVYSEGCYSGSFDWGGYWGPDGDLTFLWPADEKAGRSGSELDNLRGTAPDESIAEHLLNSKNGFTAFIGNTHFGWNGPSLDYHQQFIDKVFGEGKNLGKAVGDSKEAEYILNALFNDPNSGLMVGNGGADPSGGPSSWLFDCINLFGNPLTDVKGADRFVHSDGGDIGALSDDSFGYVYSCSDETGDSKRSSCISLSYSFDEPEISDVVRDGEVFSEVSMLGCENCKIPDAPSLPVKTVSVLLPPQSSIVSVDVDSSDMKLVSSEVGNIDVGPVSYYPLGYPDMELRVLDAQNGTYTFVSSADDELKESLVTEPTWDKNSVYPTADSSVSGDGSGVVVQYKRGMPVLFVNLYPIKYDPSSGSVSYCDSMTLNIELEEDSEAPLHPLYRGFARDLDLVEDIVENPSMTEQYEEIDTYQDIDEGIEANAQIDIKSIGGAFKVNIKNIGETDLSDLSYTITVKGGLLNLIDKSVVDTIEFLAVDEEKSFDIGVFGFGFVDIAVDTDVAGSKTIKAFVIGKMLLTNNILLA